MRTGSCCFLAGILLFTGLTRLPPCYLAVFLPVCVGLAWMFPRLRWPAWFVGGFLWALCSAHIMLAGRLSPDFEGEVVQVRGRVASLPEQKERSVQFDFRVASFSYKQKPIVPSPKTLRLNWYHPPRAILPGDHLQLRVRLKRPHGFMNPGGFDYEGWLFRQSIHATGYVVAGAVVKDKEWERFFSIHWYRYLLRGRLESILQATPGREWIYALTLGDRSGISQAQWRALNYTGTSHLLAISGLHIGLIAAFAYFIVRWLWPLAGRAALWIATPRVAAVASLLAALVYSGLAGFTIPTQRALTMLAIVLYLAIFLRITTVSRILAVALLVVLVFDPFSVLAPGFWLSFAAVALIALALTSAGTGRWRQWGRVQWYIFLGLSPLLAYWFQQIPLLSLLANSIAVPWVSLITVPAVLAGTVLLAISDAAGGALLQIGARSLVLLERGLAAFAALDHNLLLLPQVTIAALIAGMTGAVLLLLPRGFPGKWMGVFWFLPLLFPRIDTPEPGEFRFTLLEVGQGLAAVVQTREHLLLYDSGPRFSRDFNAGWAVVIPYLRHIGHSRVDMQILSHGDSDHSGGLAAVLAAVKVEKILTSVPALVVHNRAEPCHSGQRWEWDGVVFAILHPRSGTSYSGNDRSCVLKISSGAHSVLLTGDIERRAERDLVKRATSRLPATVLVAPHHGSKTSSTRDFIRAVGPRYVLFSVGYLNRFKFPNQDIIARYNEAGIEIFDTSRDGAIQFDIKADKVTVATERETESRFWHVSE